MFAKPARRLGDVIVVSVQTVNCLKIQRDVLVASSLYQFKPEIDCVNPATHFGGVFCCVGSSHKLNCVVLLFQKPKTSCCCV